VRYTKDHEWARSDGDIIYIGITDYAQDQLGDIVFVEMPEVGATFGRGEECVTIESVKTVAWVFIPVGGEIASINDALTELPALINTVPYTDGWIAQVKPDDPSEMESLMDRNAYLEMLKGMRE
jgi:glycine cleavage system H protein